MACSLFFQNYFGIYSLGRKKQPTAKQNHSYHFSSFFLPSFPRVGYGEPWERRTRRKTKVETLLFHWSFSLVISEIPTYCRIDGHLRHVPKLGKS